MHKTSLNKFKKIEIILNIFSNHNSNQYETGNYYKKKAGKPQICVNMLQNKYCVKEEIKNIKRSTDTKENDNMIYEKCRMQQKQY